MLSRVPLKTRITPKDLEKIRNMLLEQLSRLPHSPSVPFQKTPPVTEAPEEVEEPIEKRPKPRIWSGHEYDMDVDEDDKPGRQSFSANHNGAQGSPEMSNTSATDYYLNLNTAELQQTITEKIAIEQAMLYRRTGDPALYS